LHEAQAYFGDHIDFYVDGGDIGDRPPSTIARLTDSGLEVLRQGAAQIKE
jgi:tRNA A37 threonylcarbamoyladenosine synthetase subunit TsaC/SUA5/YrdC